MSRFRFGSRRGSRSGIASIEQFARLDVHRRERTGIPEVVYAEGKTVAQLVSVLIHLTEKAGQALATRVNADSARKVVTRLRKQFAVEHNVTGRTIVTRQKGLNFEPTGGCVAVLAAGTADLAVAEEARVTVEVMGCEALRFYDVGIAGIHRLAAPLREIQQKGAACVVVVAGMEGALPSVVRGLVAVPVIGVPVSTGYGHGGRGEGALMTMLQSCSPGLTVVNIDNGFGAGATAALIANRVAAKR